MSDSVKAVPTVTPKQLADELSIDPKRLRGFLRMTFARSIEQKNTSWSITPDVADAVRAHFAPKVEEVETPTES
jgi:hypothetical protein